MWIVVLFEENLNRTPCPCRACVTIITGPPQVQSVPWLPPAGERCHSAHLTCQHPDLVHGHGGVLLEGAAPRCRRRPSIQAAHIACTSHGICKAYTLSVRKGGR